MRIKIYCLFLLTLFISSFAIAGHRHKKLIRVLIIDGFSNHDWKQTSALTKQILEESKLFTVAISTAPGTPDDPAWATWDPPFEKYDVVIQNTNNIQSPALKWPVHVQQRLQRYVWNGGGLYVLHSANNAFPDWAAYNDMIGLGWRSKEVGYALQLDANNHIDSIPPGQGEGTNHGDRFNAVINIINRHPINMGYPQKWKTASIEVYRYARGPAKNVTVLSAATDSVTGKIWPVEWVVKYGKGRVYASSMGHLWKGDVYPPAYRCIGFETTMIRVAEWLATNKVTYPIPGNFPTGTDISLRPESDFPLKGN